MSGFQQTGDRTVVNLNGHSIMFKEDKLYVDGHLYIPADSVKPRPDGPVTASTKMVEKDVDVQAFNTLKLKGPVDAFVSIDPSCEEPVVKITAPDNIIDFITTDVQFSTLVVDIEPGQYQFDGNNHPAVSIRISTLLGCINEGTGLVDIDGELGVFHTR